MNRFKAHLVDQGENDRPSIDVAFSSCRTKITGTLQVRARDSIGEGPLQKRGEDTYRYLRL